MAAATKSSGFFSNRLRSAFFPALRYCPQNALVTVSPLAHRKPHEATYNKGKGPFHPKSRFDLEYFLMRRRIAFEYIYRETIRALASRGIVWYPCLHS